MSIALEDIVVGEEYEGVINNVVTYGAFVDIGTEVRSCFLNAWSQCNGKYYLLLLPAVHRMLGCRFGSTVNLVSSVSSYIVVASGQGACASCLRRRCLQHKSLARVLFLSLHSVGVSSDQTRDVHSRLGAC